MGCCRRATTPASCLPTPIVEYYLALARVLGCRADRSSSSWRTTPDDEAAADRAWSTLGLTGDQPVVCLNTGGAFGPAKNWPTASFAVLARRLVGRSEASLSWSSAGLPSAIRGSEIVRLADHPPGGQPGREPLSLGLSKACVRRAALLITTDSGPRHFAAAFETPVITLFGPTHIAWTRTCASRWPSTCPPGAVRPLPEACLPRGPSPLHANCSRPRAVFQAALRLLGQAAAGPGHHERVDLDRPQSRTVRSTCFATHDCKFFTGLEASSKPWRHG